MFVVSISFVFKSFWDCSRFDKSGFVDDEYGIVAADKVDGLDPVVLLLLFSFDFLEFSLEDEEDESCFLFDLDDELFIKLDEVEFEVADNSNWAFDIIDLFLLLELIKSIFPLPNELLSINKI